MSHEPRPLVVIFGVVPPPVSGMSLCTGCVADFLAQSCDVRRFNLSDGTPRFTAGLRMRKLGRAIAAVVRMLFAPSLRGATLYMPVNSGLALYYNLAAALVARVRGWRVIAHHHVYYYLHRYNWKVRSLDRLLPPGSTHLALCGEMRDRLNEKYTLTAPCGLLPSTILLTQDEPADARTPGGNETRVVRRLGHISNLSAAKGTPEAMQTFVRLREAGHDVQLTIAGPFMDSALETDLASLQAKFGAAVDYRGAVYGGAKRKFFEDVDLVLFPSHMEAQPLVLSEAFAFGRPVLSKAISCIPSLVGEPSWTVAPSADYVDFAVQLVTRWIDHPSEYRAASAYARQRAPELRADAERRLADLADWIRGVPREPERPPAALVGTC